MKWTKGRKTERECLEWFRPSFISGDISEVDWEIFFQKSEQGKDPEIETAGYKAINESKKWRDITLNMWQEGINDVCYWTLLGGEDEKEIPPRAVVDFMSKDLFGGRDKDLINKLYNKITL